MLNSQHFEKKGCSFLIIQEIQSCLHLKQVFQRLAICFSLEDTRGYRTKMNTDLFMNGEDLTGLPYAYQLQGKLKIRQLIKKA